MHVVLEHTSNELQVTSHTSQMQRWWQVIVLGCPLLRRLARLPLARWMALGVGHNGTMCHELAQHRLVAAPGRELQRSRRALQLKVRVDCSKDEILPDGVYVGATTERRANRAVVASFGGL